PPMQRPPPATAHALCDQGYAFSVHNRTKVPLQPPTPHPPGPPFDLPPHLAQRVLGRPARPVAKVAVVKERLEDRLQPVEQRLLTHPVVHPRDAQRTLLARLARLRYLHPFASAGRGTVVAQLLLE